MQTSNRIKSNYLKLCIKKTLYLSISIPLFFNNLAAKLNSETSSSFKINTGTRISKNVQPLSNGLIIIKSDQLELSGVVNVETILNTLPQFIASKSATNHGNTSAIATANLRGMGASNTLILVNGTRFTPTTEFGEVDLNVIPVSLIERIEILTDGASALYGSGAVAGVINFILKNNFEGITVNAGYQISQEGGRQYLEY